MTGPTGKLITCEAWRDLNACDLLGGFTLRVRGVHVHVVPESSPEVLAIRGFRDALLADPALREEYVALKRAIVDGGTVDSIAFTKAKHRYIVGVLRRLDLAGDGDGAPPSA